MIIKFLIINFFCSLTLHTIMHVVEIYININLFLRDVMREFNSQMKKKNCRKRNAHD